MEKVSLAPVANPYKAPMSQGYYSGFSYVDA